MTAASYCRPSDKISGAALHTCRYLTAFGWELSSKLSGRSQNGGCPEVIHALLPRAEAEWMAMQRSRPIALLGCMRRLFYRELEDGRLQPPLYKKLEEDLRELDHVVGSCERLFTSPLPPTMTRHLVRCLILWLGALPVCLASTMAPWVIGAWVGVTAYIFVGIEDVGSQVPRTVHACSGRPAPSMHAADARPCPYPMPMHVQGPSRLRDRWNSPLTSSPWIS